LRGREQIALDLRITGPPRPRDGRDPLSRRRPRSDHPPARPRLRPRPASLFAQSGHRLGVCRSSGQPPACRATANELIRRPAAPPVASKSREFHERHRDPAPLRANKVDRGRQARSPRAPISGGRRSPTIRVSAPPASNHPRRDRPLDRSWSWPERIRHRPRAWGPPPELPAEPSTGFAEINLLGPPRFIPHPTGPATIAEVPRSTPKTGVGSSVRLFFCA